MTDQIVNYKQEDTGEKIKPDLTLNLLHQDHFRKNKQFLSHRRILRLCLAYSWSHTDTN